MVEKDGAVDYKRCHIYRTSTRYTLVFHLLSYLHF